MLRISVLIAIFIFLVAPAAALEVPPLQGRITDLAGVLTAEEKAALDAKLRELESTDSTQIAVLIIPSLEGEALEDYSMRVAETWKIGQQGKDNGVIILVAMKERKARIEVGYGLEAILTDALSSRIMRQEILPRFKQGDYYGGIDKGVTAIAQAVRGAYQAYPDAGESSRRGSRVFEGFPVILLIPLFWIFSSAGKWGGAIIGAAAGALLPYTLFGLLWPILLLGGLIGAFLGFFMGALIHAAGSSGRGPSKFGGPFIWRTGGGFGGGFSSGGGFSGGGGGFGGGGSSGSW